MLRGFVGAYKGIEDYSPLGAGTTLRNDLSRNLKSVIRLGVRVNRTKDVN